MDDLPGGGRRDPPYRHGHPAWLVQPLPLTCTSVHLSVSVRTPQLVVGLPAEEFLLTAITKR
jgi:hypothetical protein